MKTNISIELSDGERNLLWQLIHKKEGKSLLSRRDVTALCEGAVEAALTAARGQQEGILSPRPSPVEEDTPVRARETPAVRRLVTRVPDTLPPHVARATASYCAKNGYSPGGPESKSYVEGWYRSPALR